MNIEDFPRETWNKPFQPFQIFLAHKNIPERFFLANDEGPVLHDVRCATITPVAVKVSRGTIYVGYCKENDTLYVAPSASDRSIINDLSDQVIRLRSEIISLKNKIEQIKNICKKAFGFIKSTKSSLRRRGKKLIKLAYEI